MFLAGCPFGVHFVVSRRLSSWSSKTGLGAILFGGHVGVPFVLPVVVGGVPEDFPLVVTSAKTKRSPLIAGSNAYQRYQDLRIPCLGSF